MGIETAILGSVLAGAALGVYNGQRQDKALKAATSQAQQNADQIAKQAEQAANKANAKQPAALLYDNATSQPAATMLSGPTGVDPASLALKTNKLLGQ